MGRRISEPSAAARTDGRAIAEGDSPDYRRHWRRSLRSPSTCGLEAAEGLSAAGSAVLEKQPFLDLSSGLAPHFFVVQAEAESQLPTLNRVG